MKKFGLTLLILLALTLVLASCTMTPAQSTEPTPTGTNTNHYVFFEGAEDIDFQMIPENGFATAPEAPVKEGYTFAGWLDENGNLFNFEETPITQNITLNAKWDIITFKVTFYGPDGAVIAENSVNWGEGVIRPNLALANNQEFRGWFTEANGQGEAFKVGEPVYADASYYAHVLSGAYVRFNGEDGIALAVYFLQAGEVAEAPNAPDKSGVGKEFMGWFDENGNEFDPAATYTENVTFTAKYSQNSVVVKFMSAGKLLSEVRLEKGETVEKPADPTRQGYIFGGWQLNGADYDFAQAVQESIVLNAVWTEEPVIPPTPEYTVSFAGEGVNIPAQTVKEGEKAEKPADPVREGFIFGGWTFNGEAYDFASPISGDITLTAVWTAEVIEDHTVTFVDGEGNVLSTETVPHGGNATMPTLSGDTYFAYDLSKLVNVRENLTLVVTPVAKSEYAVKDYYLSQAFVKDDPRVEFDGFLAAWATVLYDIGQSFSFTENFAGKLQIKPFAPTNSDAEKTPKFQDGQSMTIEVAVDGYAVGRLTINKDFKRQFYTMCENVPAGEHTVSITVVAMEGITPDKYGANVCLANILVYEKTAPVVKHTVSFAGEGVNIPAQEVISGQSAVKPANPVREGYAFAGWLLDGQAYDFTAPVSGDITLTASWTENTTPPVDPTEYTVTFVDGEGNVIGTQNVLPGENAKLPTSADFFYEFSPADALYNINESKTIVLTPVAKTGYSDPTELSTMNASAYTHAGMSTTGKLKNYATLLYRVGQEFKFTADMAGLLQIKFAQFNVAAGMSISFDILVDGVVVNNFVMQSDFVRNFYEAAYIPSAGEHTVIVRITAMDGVASPNYDWQVAVGVCNLIVSEKIVAPTEFSVSFAGEGVDIPAQTVAAGGVATKPADPVREGYVFKGWLLDGQAYDFTAPVSGDITLTASWEEEVVVPPAPPTEYTVTFVDGDGNVIATQTVLPGGNVELPASNTYYYACDVAKLYNIQADATIVLAPVAKSEYAEKDYFISVDMINNDDRVTFDGFNASWGALLWNMNQSLSFTEEFGGSLRIKPYAPADKYTEGQSMTIEVAVDGVVMSTLTIDMNFKRQFYTVCSNVPAGEHTITITVVEMVGIDSPNKYGCAVGLANIMIQEKTAPVVKHTVTFAGESVNIPAQEIVEGEAAQKPADPVREGYAFAGWLLDGQAYDFTAPVSGDITLTASWTEDSTPPAPPTEYTVTFVDGEGNVIGTQNVLPGENAKLPTSNDYFYEFSPADALYNINESKTIVLTPVAKTGYSAPTELSTMNASAYTHAGMSTTGALKNYATLLFRVGQEFKFTADMAGLLQIKFAQFNLAEGQSISFDILVDGVVVNQFVIEKDFVRNFYDAAYIPTAGEHTVTVRITAMDGVATPNYNWGVALGVCNLVVSEKVAAAE